MIRINLLKAKEIAHTRRRAAREREMAPMDDIVMKRIPGQNANAAEAERAKLRTKYAHMQTAIDAAQSVDALKAALASAD